VDHFGQRETQRLRDVERLIREHEGAIALLEEERSKLQTKIRYRSQTLLPPRAV
jgi:hypothetical protein